MTRANQSVQLIVYGIKGTYWGTFLSASVAESNWELNIIGAKELSIKEIVVFSCSVYFLTIAHCCH
jgi:hypothetical protein